MKMKTDAEGNVIIVDDTAGIYVPIDYSNTELTRAINQNIEY